MDISLRACLTAGVATITAAAVAFGPSVQQPTPAPTPASSVQTASPPVQLTAEVQPLAVTDLPNLLIGWVQRVIVPPSAGQPFPTPQFPPVVAPTSIGSSIIWVYNAIEPWARYAADLAAYAVGWIPYVGWLAPQITIFYNFGERIARSITYNIAYWLDGNISFVQGLVNVGVDTVNSFIQLGIDEWNFWLPPLPPLPPFPFAATQQTAAVTEGQTTMQVNQKRSAVVADEEATDVVDKKADLDVIKKPKEPKTATPKTTESAKVSKDEKKGDTSPKHDTKKNDDNGKKKGDKE